MACILLDTKTLVDFLTDVTRLDENVVSRIEVALREGQLAISAVTLLQLREMRRRGELSAEAVRTFEELAAASGLVTIPIDSDVIRDLDSIPEGQPLADRIVAATALAKTYQLVTSNVALRLPALHVDSPLPSTFEVAVVQDEPKR
jgi:PIN domain nuclease of toxin-antitoxin system